MRRKTLKEDYFRKRKFEIEFGFSKKEKETDIQSRT
jgi:hypothetical protein